MHQRASPERLRVHAEPESDGQRAGQADQRPRRGHRPDGHDPADDLSADPGGRGVRHARLHQRRAARGGSAARQPDGRQPRLRHHADGAPRALPRGVRPRAEGVAGEGDLRVEREVLPARQVNLWPRPIQQPHPPVWVPGSGSISTFDFATEHNVCYCFLSYAGAARRQDDDGRLLGRRGEEGARAQPVPRGLPAARRGVGDGRAGGDRLREARRVLLPQVPARAAAVVRPAGQPGLPQPARGQSQSGAAAPRIPRRSATRISWTRATSSRAARPPCGSG